jgi:hypothetical protein
VICDLDKRTQKYEKWKLENPNKKEISTKEVSLILKMTTGMNKVETALELLNDVGNIYEFEAYFDYKDVSCKAKLDILNYDKLFIADLKTTKNCNDIDKTIANFDYHRQAKFYQIAMKQLTGLDFDFYFIFVEKESPFGVRVVKLDSQYLATAESEIDYLLNVYKEYLLNPNDVYLPYNDTVETIYKPTWKM